MKRNYDLKTNFREYQIGDVVYVLDTATVKGRCRKLSATWKGPGLIVDKCGTTVYKIKIKDKFVVLNHDRLKLCEDRELPKYIQRWKTQLDRGDIFKTDIYCVCKGPYTGSFMIQCDSCREWFHGVCVGVTSEQAKTIDTYECPQCSSSP